MATISFLVFMVLALIITRILTPKNKLQIWFYSILIPIISLILFAFIMSKGSIYLAGGIVAQSIISMLVMSAILLFFFYRRYKKKNENKNIKDKTNKSQKNHIAILLILLVIIGLGFNVLNKRIENRNNDNIEELIQSGKYIPPWEKMKQQELNDKRKMDSILQTGLKKLDSMAESNQKQLRIITKLIDTAYLRQILREGLDSSKN